MINHIVEVKLFSLKSLIRLVCAPKQWWHIVLIKQGVKPLESTRKTRLF